MRIISSFIILISICNLFAQDKDSQLIKELTNKARECSKEDDYNAAILHITKAIEISKRPELYYNRSFYWSLLGNENETIEDLNKAVDASKNKAFYWNIRGREYFYQEKYQKAITDYHNAGLILDDNKIMLRKGIAQYKAREVDNAVDTFQALMNDKDVNYNAKFYLGWIATTTNNKTFRDPKLGLSLIIEAIEYIGKLDYEDEQIVAASYASNNKFDLAIEHQTKAIQLIKEYFHPIRKKKYLKTADEMLETFKNNKPWYEHKVQ